jgi:hypothetical protein
MIFKIERILYFQMEQMKFYIYLLEINYDLIIYNLQYNNDLIGDIAIRGNFLVDMIRNVAIDVVLYM